MGLDGEGCVLKSLSGTSDKHSCMWGDSGGAEHGRLEMEQQLHGRCVC